MSIIRPRILAAAAILLVTALALVLVFAAGAAASPSTRFQPPTAQAGTPLPPAAETGEETVYVVKSGDSLARIAARFRTTPQKLLEINELASPQDIFVGQTLRITSGFGATTDLGGNPIDCLPAGPLPPANGNAAGPAIAPSTGMISQTFQLQPGWNAVFLEIQPEPREVAAALSGIPVGCVYAHLGQSDRRPAAYHRGSAPDSNLYTLSANHAYLMKLEGDSPVPWTVYGWPLVQEMAWAADRLTETGLHVDPDNPPTFGHFFAPSAAHADFQGFRLDPSGRWEPVTEQDFVRPGAAYRIFSSERSSYDGPLSIATDLGNELQFGRTLTERSLRVANVTSAPRAASVRALPGPNPVPLSYALFDPQGARLRWVPLDDAVQLPQDGMGATGGGLAPGESRELRLAVRRVDMAPGDDSAASVLEIRDGAGTRRLVTVSAQPQIALEVGADEAARAAANAGTTPNQLAGLWIGNVVVDHVGVANRIAPDLYFDLELALLGDRVVTQTVTGPDGLATISTTVQTIRDALVPVGSSWRYHTGDPPAAEWIQATFDDSAWPSGDAALGFGNRIVETAIEPPDSGVVFFRQAFTLPITLADGDLELRLRRDDGAIVYLNGVEVLRSNMTEGLAADPEPVTRVAGNDETSFEVFSTKTASPPTFSHPDPVSLLVEGVNVLAVAMHQYVGERAASGSNLEPTASEFRFRVLIHVDEGGQARLLKEAILMRDPVSGEDVLLTDSARVREFAGAGLRDGQPVGRRASTAAYDFAGDDATTPGALLLSGDLQPGGALTARIDLGPSFPTNPFKHRYHPDHDNLKDGIGTVLADDQAESYGVTREIELIFHDGDELQAGGPGWGDTLLVGDYGETLRGLHQQPLTVRGTFLLRRASNVTTLNPESTQAQ